jgi:hypothetical protein
MSTTTAVMAFLLGERMSATVASAADPAPGGYCAFPVDGERYPGLFPPLRPRRLPPAGVGRRP